MKKSVVLFTAIASLALVVGASRPASASTITFDLSSPITVTYSSPHTFTSGGLNLTAKGLDPSNNVVSLTDEPHGLGVVGGANGLANPGEAIDFSFSPNQVTLLSQVTFGSNSPTFSLYVDGILKVSNQSLANGTSTFTFAGGGYFGADFKIVEGGSSTSALRVTGLNVETGNSSTAAAVPEPGSMVLLGTGLLGLVRQIKKRTKKSGRK